MPSGRARPAQFVACCFSCQEKLYLADPGSIEYLYTKEEFDELARTVDQAKTGRINYLSFLGLFSAAQSTGTGGGGGGSPLLARPTAAGVFIEHTFKRAINWVGAAIFLSALVAYAAIAYNRRTAPKTVPGALTRSCSYVVATHASSPYDQPPAMAPAQAHDRHGEAARAHDRYESAARAAAFRVAQPDERTRLAPG